MKSNENRNQQEFMKLKFGDYLSITTVSNRTYTRREFDFQTKTTGFDDYVNVLATDGQSSLFIGTEKGRIYHFCISDNQMVRKVECDHWLNSICYKEGKYFAVGGSRMIHGYNVVSGRLAWRMSQNQANKAYSVKGILLIDTQIKHFLIFNAGYGVFRILDSKKLKLVYSFDVSLDLHHFDPKYSQHSLTILNYCIFKTHHIISFIPVDDNFIYFYDFKMHKILKRIRLFETLNLKEDGSFKSLLVNVLMMELDGYLFLILQFSDNSPIKPKITTIFILILVSLQENLVKAVDFIFLKELSKINLLQKT